MIFLVKKSDLIKILIINFHYDIIVPNTGCAGLCRCLQETASAAALHLSVLEWKACKSE